MVIAATGTPAFAEGPQELTPAELGALQSNQYSVPANVAFNAVIATLHSFGYMDVQANRDAGTVSATTEAKGKAFFNIFWGFGKKKLTQRASIFVEPVGEQSSNVRVNMHVNEAKVRGLIQTSFADGKLIRYAAPYQDFYRVLDAEIARRAGTVTQPISDPGGVKPVAVGTGVTLVPANTASGYCIKAGADYVGTGSASRPTVTAARPLCS